MADLVRVRLNGVEKNVGRAFAEDNDLKVIDAPTTRPDGRLAPDSRANGRPMKPKTSVAKEASEKKDKAADAPASTAEEATE